MASTTAPTSPSVPQCAIGQSSPSRTPPPLAEEARSPVITGTSLAPPAPGSPSRETPSSSSNRFGLSLSGFIQRRPRGSTNPLSMRQPSSPGGRSPAGGSPSSELPPSPSGGERSSGYGFPVLRRQLSRRTGGNTPEQTPRTTRAGRSTSQPRQNGTAVDSRPSTPLETPLAQTSSLPAGAAQAAAATTSAGESAAGSSSTETFKIRLVPHLESSRSLHFEPVDRDVAPFVVLRVGRFTDRSLAGQGGDPHRIAFKSKVVSRVHAEIWSDDAGKFFIKDTKSSSGTFLNHIRLSGPAAESRPFPLKDGDVLQLGVDYQGGTEEIYRCVKMRIELNRGWQRGMNSFNTAALAQLRALGGGSHTDVNGVSQPIAASMSAAPTQKAQMPAASVTDCCICLYPVTVCQALFIAPCSHVTHFKCIRPLITQNYPGFCCPLCRTYADLEADVEVEWEEPAPPETVEERPEEEAAAAAVATQTNSTRRPSIEGANISRRSSLAVSGADNVPVALHISEHHRPPSLRSGAATTADNDNTITQHSIPLPIAMPSAEVYNSLSEAATPPNSTFLSTLADSNSFPRYHAPVSLDMALNKFVDDGNDASEANGGQGDGDANPSASTSTNVPARTSRVSLGSGSEDETEGGPREDDDAPSPSLMSSEKADKGKQVEGRSSIPTAAPNGGVSKALELTGLTPDGMAFSQ